MTDQDKEKIGLLAKELYGKVRGLKDRGEPMGVEVEELDEDVVEASVYVDVDADTYEWESDHSMPSDWEPRTKQHRVTLDVGEALMFSIGVEFAAYYFGYLADKSDDESYMADCKEAYYGRAWKCPRVDGESVAETMERILGSEELIDEMKRSISRRRYYGVEDLDDKGLVPEHFLRESSSRAPDVAALAKKICGLYDELTGGSPEEYLGDPSLVNDLIYDYLESSYRDYGDKDTIIADFPAFSEAVLAEFRAME